MRTIAMFGFASVFLSLTAGAVPAQEKCSKCSAAHRHGPPALLLLSRKAIRDDLKLTDEQSKRVREALVKQITAFVDASDLSREERTQKMPELREQGRRAAAEILTPEQLARLKQIKLQIQGPRAFGNPELARELKITDEQRAKIAALFQAAKKDFVALCATGSGKSDDAHQKMTELRRRVREQMLSVLTEEQRARWKEMTGEPVQGDVHFWHRGAGRHHACARN